MAENLNNNDFEEMETCILTDEDGVETPFEIVDRLTVDGVEYIAFCPLDSDECEYVILKKTKDENGMDCYMDIEDDDEFEDISAAFEDRLFTDFDLDVFDGEEGDE